MATTFIGSSSAEQKTYIVHMDKNKATNFDAIVSSMNKLSSQDVHEIDDAIPPQLIYTYKTAINGFAVKLSKKQLESLKKVDGVISATPDEMLQLHTTRSPNFLGLHSEAGLWSSSNLAADVIIGVIDTGIYPQHASFRDTGMPPVPSRWKGACETGANFSASSCNKKLIGARVFYRGYESSGYINASEEYMSPRDGEGHGTHTASTAAGTLVPNADFLGLAKGSAVGMRHTSRIAAYKVCWKHGCSDSDVMAAIDAAVTDGVDVISMSLGGVPKSYDMDNIAIATYGAVQKGVIVACSAGNSGPSSSSVSNSAPWILTVAASYLDRRFPTVVKLGNGQTFKGSSLYFGKSTKQLQIIDGEKASNKTFTSSCTSGSLDEKLVKGKIVVCRRGISSRALKGEAVKEAKGVGMLIVNTKDEGEELLTDAHVLPASSLGARAGQAIAKYLNSTKNPTAQIIFKGTTHNNLAPVMAGFSSRGPNSVGPDVIKPDITAPGMNILAAWPPELSPTDLESDKRRIQFNIISGTSMSCPHISGIAALIKSVHKDWSPAAVKSAIMTTAYAIANDKFPIRDIAHSGAATPFALGSGHVNPELAADPGLVYDITPKDYHDYVCGIMYAPYKTLKLTKDLFVNCPGNTSQKQPPNLNYPSFSVDFTGNSQNVTKTKTYLRTVTNVGCHAKARYLVKVEKPDGVQVKVEPKVLKFQKKGQKLSYNVSFVPKAGNFTSDYSFGSLVWVSGKYAVRSPIAFTIYRLRPPSGEILFIVVCSLLSANAFFTTITNFSSTEIRNSGTVVCEKKETRCSFLSKRGIHKRGMWTVECDCRVFDARPRSMIDYGWDLESLLCPCRGRNGEEINISNYARCNDTHCSCKSSNETMRQFQKDGRTSAVQLRLRRGLYHELYNDITKYSFPDLVIAPNAGLAAYPSWLPTIELLKEIDVPTVFSDYCEEACNSVTGCRFKISTYLGDEAIAEFNRESRM
ncbi:hypothetical protein ACFE04_026251 [Oxalis oulophora]